MDDTDYGELLLALVGELAARELSLKLARQCRIAPGTAAVEPDLEIPADLDLCAHLPLDGTGRRGALLLCSGAARSLVSEARRRGTVGRRDPEGERHQRLADLLAAVLARPCALLGFLGGQGLHLRGVTVQELDTPPKRTAHQIAFRRQGMVWGELRLEIHGLAPMTAALLLPDELFGAAAVSLTDPEHLRVTDDVFLERAPAVGREVEAWVEELLAGEEGAEESDAGDGEGAGPAAADEAAAPPSPPEVAALSELLDEVLSSLPAAADDVVLQSPEDLIFAQLFFPRMLAQMSRQAGCTLQVRAVEMASVSLSRMRDEAGGLLARIVFAGGFDGDTCLVFPEAETKALAEALGCSVDGLAQLLTAPGLGYMAQVSPALQGELRPLARIDFAGYEGDADQYALRLRYDLVVQGQEVLSFAQYASPAFVNRLVSALAGEEVEVLKANKRNLMLSFLSLNALIGAVAVEDPERAAEWLGPVMGAQYVPLYRPGDELPDMYDFDVLASLARADLERLLEWPPLAAIEVRTLARALRFVSAETRRKLVDAGPREWRQRLAEQERHRDGWSPKEVWEARRAFAEVLHGGIANSGVEATVAVAAHLGWRQHRLSLAWRLRGAQVLEDGIFIVPFMLDFDTLAELSNRDMTVVLERWVLGRLDLDTLGCALARPRCPVLPRVLANVSDRRRRDIIEAAERPRPDEEVFSAQHFLAEHVYFAALKGIIHPPPAIQEQIDRYVTRVDENLDDWCEAVLQDRTYSRLLARLTAGELNALQRLVGREEVLWSLQEAPVRTVETFGQALSDEAWQRLAEDLEAVGRREESAQRRAWRTAEARLQVVDAARLELQLRGAGRAGPGV